jgi:hypothetical protein
LITNGHPLGLTSNLKNALDIRSARKYCDDDLSSEAQQHYRTERYKTLSIAIGDMMRLFKKVNKN